MANWELNPAFTSVNSKVGNIVFYKMNGKIYSRKAPGKRTKNTEPQQRVTESFTTVSDCWKSIDGIIRESWKSSLKDTTRVSPRALFIGANIGRHKNGEALELSKNLGENGFVSFSARTGNTEGEIICEYIINQSDAAKFITFFRQERVNGTGSDQITRIENKPGVTSPCTITGCKPGAEYFIYAVITDREYKDATTVSYARSAQCTAMQNKDNNTKGEV